MIAFNFTRNSGFRRFESRLTWYLIANGGILFYYYLKCHLCRDRDTSSFIVISVLRLGFPILTSIWFVLHFDFNWMEWREAKENGEIKSAQSIVELFLRCVGCFHVPDERYLCAMSLLLATVCREREKNVSIDVIWSCVLNQNISSFTRFFSFISRFNVMFVRWFVPFHCVLFNLLELCLLSTFESNWIHVVYVCFLKIEFCMFISKCFEKKV